MWSDAPVPDTAALPDVPSDPFAEPVDDGRGRHPRGRNRPATSTDTPDTPPQGPRASVLGRMRPVTTPPRVTKIEVAAALHRIGRRRIDHGDTRWDQVDQESPAAVLDHVLAHPLDHAGHAAAQDVVDGLVINIWLWWEDRERELKLLRRGIQAGIPKSQLGAPRGIGSQGVEDRINAHIALLERGRPDHKLTREDRRDQRRDLPPEDPELRWLARHHDWIVEVARGLVQSFFDTGLAGDEGRSWLYEVREDLADDEWSRASIIVMRTAVQAIEAQPDVVGLHGKTPAKRALAAFHALDNAFANLSGPPRAAKRTTPAKRRGTAQSRRKDDAA